MYVWVDDEWDLQHVGVEIHVHIYLSSSPKTVIPWTCGRDYGLESPWGVDEGFQLKWQVCKFSLPFI